MHAPSLSPLKHFITPIFQPVIHRSKKKIHQRRGSRLLRTNSSETLFEQSITNFKTHLLERGHPENCNQTTLSEVTFEDRNQALRQNKNKTRKSCPFVMLRLHHPAVPKNKFSFSFRKFQ